MGLKERLEAEIAMLEGRLGYRSGGRVQRFNTGGDPDATTPYYTDDDVEADEPPDQWPNPALTGGYPGTGGDTEPDPYPDPGVDPNPGDGGTVPNPGGSGDIPPFQMAGWDENGNFVGFTPEEIQAMTDQLQSEGTDQSTIDAFLAAAGKGWNALTTFFSDNKNSNLLKGALGLWLGERTRRSNNENNEANRQDTRNSREQSAREFLVNQQDEVHTEYTAYMDRAASRNRAEMAQRIAMGMPRSEAEALYEADMQRDEQTAMNRAGSRMGYIQASMKGAPYAGGVMDASIAFGATGPQPGGTTTQPTGGLNQVTGPSTGGTDPTVGAGTVGVPGTQGGMQPGGLNQASGQPTVGGGGAAGPINPDVGGEGDLTDPGNDDNANPNPDQGAVTYPPGWSSEPTSPKPNDGREYYWDGMGWALYTGDEATVEPGDGIQYRDLAGTIPVVGAPGGNAGAAGAQRIDTGAGGLTLAGQSRQDGTNPDIAHPRWRQDHEMALRRGVQRAAVGGPARGGLSQVSQQPRYFAGGTKGQDDRIPALLSDGEYVMDAETVAALGDGNSKAGAAELDRMRERIRRHKRSGSIKKIPPKSKGALNYLKGGR